MASELRATVINMKRLSQDLPDPVVIGAGDREGCRLRIIFAQEAAAQFTENTKIYLAWYHEELDVKGYNVFTEIKNPDVKNYPPTWEITYPKSMLYEGHVLACIQLVDNVSIATSTNFLIHVLQDPNDGSRFTATDDFSLFQEAVINLTNLADDVQAQMEEYETEFEEIRATAETAQEIAEEAREIAENALATAAANSDRLDVLENTVSTNTADIINLTATIGDIADQIEELIDKTGITEEEALDLINQELIGYVTEQEAQAEHDALWAALQIREFGLEDG